MMLSQIHCTCHLWCRDELHICVLKEENVCTEPYSEVFRSDVIYVDNVKSKHSLKDEPDS